LNFTDILIFTNLPGLFLWG